MSKDTRFSIHDWQAKQRLKEQERPFFANQKYYDLLNDLRDEGHLHRYGITQLQMQFGLSEEEAQKIYNQYKEDLKAEQPDAYDFYMKDLNEHHAGDYNPGFLKQSVNTFLDKLKKKTKEGKDYKTVEKIMEKHFSAKKANEASTTGTGASVTAGTGAAYATPKAFGDDKNKKKKGYMGYKEI
jgi:hypothetical protein